MINNNISRARMSDEKHCVACGKIIHVSAEICPSCGAKQINSVSVGSSLQTQQLKSADQKFCTACGNIVHITADICPKCGAKQQVESIKSGSKNKVTAGILALFFGSFGVHKFYLNKPVMGIIYLIFFWTFIPSIVALIEGIGYLTMDENVFQERYRMGNL